jgi:predicted RND superfamily exporter protein
VFSFPPVRHFGALSAIAFFGAVISTLVLLPAILDWRRWRALTKDVPESEK